MKRSKRRKMAILKAEPTELVVIDDDGDGRNVKSQRRRREDGRTENMETIVIEETGEEEDTDGNGKTEMKRSDEGNEGSSNKRTAVTYVIQKEEVKWMEQKTV